MQTDTNLIFVSANTSITWSATNSVLTSYVLDLGTGLMTNTTAPVTYSAPAVSGGLFLLTTSYQFGEDLGPGALRLRGQAWLSSATPTTGTMLTIAWQGAVDASSGTYPANYSGLTWSTYALTEIPVADMAPLVSGNVPSIPLPDFPDRLPETGLPRFIRLQFSPSGSFTSLTVNFAGIAIQRPDVYVGKYPGGFQVAP